MSEELEEGWGLPGNATKAHYFLRGDARSLCMKWMYTWPREKGNDGSRDNCADCKRRLAATFARGAGDGK
jgi:hypothetical protein